MRLARQRGRAYRRPPSPSLAPSFPAAGWCTVAARSRRPPFFRAPSSLHPWAHRMSRRDASRNRPQLRDARSFPLAGFDTDVLPTDVLQSQNGKLDKATLLECLQDGRAVVRLNAVRALAALATPLPAADVPTVSVSLRDTDPGVRAAAATTLRHVADCLPAVPFLLEASIDKSAAVAEAARDTLHGFGGAMLPGLEPYLSKPWNWFAARVAPVLARQGATALDFAIRALEGGDPTARDNMLATFEQSDDEAIRSLLAAIGTRAGPTFELVRERLGRAAGVRARSAAAAPRAAISYALDGFDTDLLAVDLIAKSMAKLPRADMLVALRDGRIAVRVNALQALAAHAPLTLAESAAVAVLLKDTSASVRSAAVRAIVLAPNALDILPVLTLVSADKDARVARDAAEAVHALGTPAIDALVKLLLVEPEIADATLLPLLVRHGEAARPALVRVLHHPDARVRCNALAGLIGLGSDALVQSTAQVTIMTRDQDPAVRALARQALSMIARATRPHIAEVRPLPLDDFADKVVDEAEMKKASKKLSASALLALAQDGRPLVRGNAWRGLQALGPLDSEAAMRAAVACKDVETDVRREAALSLRGCPDEALATVVPVLVHLARDPDKAASQAARQIVFSFGKKAVPHVVALFAARDGAANAAAVRIAVAMSDDSAPGVLAAIESPLPLVRENALRALADIGGKVLDGAMDRVVARLSDSHDGARFAAVAALRGMSADVWRKRGDLRDVARRLAREDSSRVVRDAAVAWATELDRVAL
ncbi:MAG: hypothetical protein EXR79_12980 [Myxococcales bacterium]|nr:hypothetical protein [Myxococcales bacterium]